MTIGSRVFKNGKYHGILEFNSGKKVILKHKDWIDFENKLRDIEYTGRLKEKTETNMV